ncbi:uncharacterized protein LAESUDRAFT_719910 [Laetiporus sulphureus 93-53]|uniref:Nucleolar protein 12 n=1 Tax=Laetiporus sulphureus 93-53 TaxID=1314785 RepID=A0A165HNC8_9APHY|nr:uncharacterized protein LAESUDRAFT_719910 [Laetiporus sulphureus 93-53]KZT11964.1 hypothetical protein LAESUDRAFT_719910 [Laetiporus sulphureus 93-53]
MSLSSLLLHKGKDAAIDKGLDNIFQSTTGLSTSASSQPNASLQRESPKLDKKRKSREAAHAPVDKREKSKRRKTRKVADEDSQENPPEDQQEEHSSTSKPSTSAASKARRVRPETAGSDEDSDDSEKPAFKSTSNPAQQHESSDGDSDDEGHSSELVHESLAKGSRTRSLNGRRAKTKYVPLEETSEQRNARTIFVGNVPVDVVKSRPLQKQFKRHILSFVSSAKIESLRFRSVAFQSPTAELPTLDDNTKGEKGKGKATFGKEKEGRQHDRERAASWRVARGQEDAEEERSKKTFLTPKEKKRIAFIKHEIHSAADAVNAFVVFAHPPPPVADGKHAVTSHNAIIDPYEAARLAVERGDGSVFMAHTIRVDRVGKGDEVGNSAVVADPKATVFVGNLDFASNEEDLRAFFEALAMEERGPPEERENEESEDEEGDEDEGNAVKPRTWVKRVRIIRDKDTQLGKGFAYVQFADRECVDEILALDETRLKFAKRKLRVQRCKTVPGSVKITPKHSRSAVSSSSSAHLKHPSVPFTPSSLPKGDPSLGTKISHLPKEERKKVKAADAERVARRLAKKQAKLLAEKGVKMRAGKERMRERRRPTERKDKASGKEKSKSKGRIRSGKSIARMNTKK